MKLNVAVQMDPIARINIRGDSTFALLLEAQKRGHGLSYYTPDKLSLKGEEGGAPGGAPFSLRRHPGAAGSALRSRLHYFDPSARTAASEDVYRQRPRQRSQR